MAEVVLEGIVKRFGRTQVVHGLDLRVADGEFVVLVGPSGCGKSTTLRMIAGLEEVDAGTISIGGRVVNRLEPKARNIAMVFQNYAIYPHMSVRKNIAFGLRTSGLPQAERQQRIEGAAAILGLSDYLDRRPAQLSGGQRQRVAIGRAMVRDPSVFLFDEPLSNLDAQLRTTMRIEIKKLHQRLGTTVIYVTHDQIEAMTLADRIVVMKDGRIQQVGTPAELYRRPANVFTARFIGSPPMNLLPAELGAGDDGGRVRVDGVGEVTLQAVSMPPHRGRVVLGVRPEDFALYEDGLGAAGRAPRALSIGGVVAVVEPLGGEALVHVEVGGETLIAKLAGRDPPRPGSHVRLEAPEDRLHVFDAQTQTALWRH